MDPLTDELEIIRAVPDRSWRRHYARLAGVDSRSVALPGNVRKPEPAPTPFRLPPRSKGPAFYANTNVKGN